MLGVVSSVTPVGAILGILAVASSTPVQITRKEIVLFHVIPDDRTDMTRPARDVLEGLTRLTLRAPEDLGLDSGVLQRCEGSRRFSCWLDAVTERSSGASISYLVTLTIHGDGPLDRLAVMVVDLQTARAERAEVRQDAPGWQEQLENRIFERAVVAEVAQIPRGEPQAVTHFFETLFGRSLGAVFERRGAWAPNGAVSVKTQRPDLTILLDGRPIGQTTLGTTRIEGLREGSRILTLWAGEEKVAEAQIEILRGQTTSVEANVALPEPETVWRDVTLWGGVGVAAAGAALGIWSLAASGEVSYMSCGEPGCSGSEHDFARLGGVLGAPLGYSLAVTGVSASLGALLVDEEELLWVPVLVGVVLGSLSYGLSAALD